MSTTKKRVVIIGCGYAGAMCASSLDSQAGPKGSIDLVVINKRGGFFLNKFAAIRAATVEGDWVARAMIPLDSLLKNGKIVGASVVSIDQKERSVLLDNGERVPYDVLCIASGSRNFSPAEPPISASSKEATQMHFTATKAALCQTKSVVIIGAGPVGIELAGEIKAFGRQDVQITIVTKGDYLLHGKVPPTKGNIASVESLLKQVNVEVIYKDEVASVPFPTDLSVASAIVATPDGVTLKSGKEIKCDLLVYAIGSSPNTDFVPPEWRDPTSHEVVVDEKTLLVAGTTNVFCIGDAAKINFTKLGYFAMEDAKIIAKNILDVVQAKAPSRKIARGPMMMVLPFGPKKGRLLTPYMTMGNWVTSKVKGAGLFTKMMWGQIAKGRTPPS